MKSGPIIKNESDLRKKKKELVLYAYIRTQKKVVVDTREEERAKKLALL